MHAQAVVAKERRAQPVARSLPALGVQARFHEAADNGPQTRQLRSMQLMANGSQRAERINALARAIQRKPAPAQVTWGITHVVKKHNDSIFGSGNYEEGEVGRAGELRQGQELIVDDDDIFVSRRGANQEDATIRDSQRMKDPSHAWIRVLRLGRADVSSLNLYIRLETIVLVEPVASDQRPILILAMPWDSSEVSSAAKEMGEEYVTLRNGPEQTAGAYKCSDPHWGLIDEGADVAKRLQIPDEREPGPLTRDDEPGYSRLFIAHYQGDLTPIAIMQLEMRLEHKGLDVPQLYIRWLLGHPHKPGGGSSLVAHAKVEAIKEAEGRLRVDSAMAAETWYIKQGFQTVYGAEHETDEENTGKEEGDEDWVDPVKCGCKFMKWTEASF